jgi:hypothetical protein
MQQVEKKLLLKKYLLGELDNEQQMELEMRLLTDAEYFDELLLVEDELTDDFVFGVLPDDENERIQNHFLAVPERREKLKITRTIEQYFSESATGGPTADTKWEDRLSEAQAVRQRFGALISNNWMGLHLLSLLQHSPLLKSELSSKLNATNSVVTTSVNQLISSGLIEEIEGLLFCTTLGTESLQNFENIGMRNIDTLR